MSEDIPYYHNEEAHNQNDPDIIVPVIMDVLKPSSVIDVGCGIGTFLHVFKKYGVDNILGLDGVWVDSEKLKKHISIDNFREVDFEKGFDIKMKYDLALCLEVAEHLHEKKAELFVENLTSVSDTIIFSASIPGQMGQNHLNEQWPSYWMNKFQKHDFICYDVFRPIFWNNSKVSRWCKQNMFLYLKNGSGANLSAFYNYVKKNISHYVHPEYYELRLNDITRLTAANRILENNYNNIVTGKAKLKNYLGYFLKYILLRIGMYNK